MTDVPVPPPGAYHCPACGAPMTPEAPCPRCGRNADPQAPRLVAVNAEIADLVRRIESTRGELTRLTDTWQVREAERRDLSRAMVTAVFAARAVPVAVGAPEPVGSPASVGSGAPSLAGAGPAMPWPGSDRLGTSDASPRTVQNLLFVLGGVLLGIGAIVFTVVAWATYGMVGRVSILAIATLIALSVPIVAKRRNLVATAETFTAIGLLLVALDGYGAYRLDLFGLAETVAGTTYAAVVLAIAAAVGLGYGVTFDLAGPPIVSVIAIQPVLPLLSASHRPGITLVAATYAAVATVDFVVARLFRSATGDRPAGAGVQAARILALVFGGFALSLGSLTGLTALVAENGIIPVLRAAAVVVVCAVILLRVATRTEVAVLRGLGVAVAVLEAEAALAAGTAATGWHDHPYFIISAVTAITVTAAIRLRTVSSIGAGLIAAAWASSALLGIMSMVTAALTSLRNLSLIAPAWQAGLAHLNHAGTVRAGIPVSIAVVIAGVAALVPQRHRATVALLGGVPLVVSLATLGGRWWTTPVIDVVGIVALLGATLLVARRRDSFAAVAGAGGAVALSLDGALTALARPSLTAVILGALLVIGIVTVVAFWRIPDRDGTAVAIAGGGLATALVALPVAVASLAAVYATGAVAPMRFALGAAALDVIVLLGVGRLDALRWYATSAVTAVTIAVSVTPLAFATDERLNLYAMTGRLLIALAILAVGFRGRVARLAAIPGDVLGLLAFGRIIPLVLVVVVGPYTWLGSIWSGDPHGVGIAPHAFGVYVDTLDILTAVLFTASIAAGGALLRGRRGAIAFGTHPAIVAVLVIVAAIRAPWPTLPIVALGLGAAAIGTSTLIRRSNPAATAGWTGLVVAGAGIAGLAATRTSTLYALGAALVLALVVGAAGRSTALRTAGWAAAIVAGDLLVTAAIRSVGDATVALGLLGIAALASVAAPLLGRLGRTRPEKVALDAFAHGTAFVALVSAASLSHAAVCAAGWGLLVAGRSLWPDVAATVRRALIAGGVALELVAWWLIAIERQVHLIDAYTLPAALVALIAGLLAARSRPELGSWATYGTALLAAFLPSLAPTFTHDPSEIRRLLLGAAAVVIVLIGAQTRLQAPVIVGGATAVLLAIEELVRAWHHLPAWVPLAGTGLLIIVVASTYERRRRDWTRLRGAVTRLS